MQYLRTVVLDIMRSWIGKKMSDGSHKSIVDTYNSIKPLPVGYKVTYTDSWCATTVSAAFHKAGYDAICPLECSCPRMIEKAKKMGIWVEDDALLPSPGDIIMYDWQDNGVGDNKGTPDHVGIVEKVADSVITVIEGNNGKAVKRRNIQVNGKFIRGFITPKYTGVFSTGAPTDVKKDPINNKKKQVKSVVAKDKAVKKDTKYSGTYVTKAIRPLRDGAGQEKKAMAIVPEGTKVKCYGYYSESRALNVWLYVEYTIDNTKYTGFMNSAGLKKVK